jgi:hypothetical protein
LRAPAAVAAVVAAVLLLLLAGSAQARTRAGVAVAELAPPRQRLRSARAPLAPGLPARLVFGDTLIVDVAVTADDAAAHTALGRMLRGYSGTIGARSAAFTVDNVAVLVRCLVADCDPAAHAARARAAVLRAPTGRPTAARVLGRDGAIELPAWMLDGRVVVRGPAVVRRSSARRFVVTRTGPGALEVELVGIDDRLRPTR